MAVSWRAVMLPALVLLLSWGLGGRAWPTQELEGDSALPGATVGPVPDPTDPPDVIDVQEQIYIITGVFITFIIFLLVVSLATAYVVIGMRQTLRVLQAAGAAVATDARPGPPQRKPTRRTAPAQPQQRDNRAFAPDEDDDDDDRWGGDEVQSRGFDQFPDNRPDEARAGRPAISEPHNYDRFHQPLPDAQMPSERAARRDSHSRFGAGNLARLPKGPAPQPGGYDSRYPEDRERRTRSPGRSQW